MRNSKTAIRGHHTVYILGTYSLFVIDARSFVETFKQTMYKILSNYFYRHSRIYNFSKTLYGIIYRTMSYRFI